MCSGAAKRYASMTSPYMRPTEGEFISAFNSQNKKCPMCWLFNALSC
jgi:hypothetical protein